MNYLLIEPKIKSLGPNIALSKWARYCLKRDIQFQYIRGCVRPNIVPQKVLLSLTFTFQKYTKLYEKTINYYSNMFPDAEFIVGGVFPTLYPKWFEKMEWTNDLLGKQIPIRVFKNKCDEIENITPLFNVDITSEDELYKRDKILLYSSRGCPNKCGYCAVPKLEGDMKSFKSIKDQIQTAKIELPGVKNIVLFDNNFTAHEYFDNIVDELRDSNLSVDIHGLHVDSFDDHKAKRFSELRFGSQSINSTAYLRFSYDKLKYENMIEKAVYLIKKYNIKAQMFLYCLYNYKDTPDDFWYRVESCQKIVDKYGKIIYLFPQRYIPFNPDKSDYIGKNWNKDLLTGFKRMYSLHRLNNFIPITKQRSIYKYIGSSKDEWLEKCYELNKKNYKFI